MLGSSIGRARKKGRRRRLFGTKTKVGGQRHLSHMSMCIKASKAWQMPLVSALQSLNTVTRTPTAPCTSSCSKCLQTTASGPGPVRLTSPNSRPPSGCAHTVSRSNLATGDPCRKAAESLERRTRTTSSDVCRYIRICSAKRPDLTGRSRPDTQWQTIACVSPPAPASASRMSPYRSKGQR